MNKTFDITCPECGEKIRIVISEAGVICVGFFNVSDSEETIEIIRDIGYEFGEKGGQNGN
ncbi:MAG: hypothetical protein RSB38_03290 [Oscillospiraceae bacterium]